MEIKHYFFPKEHIVKKRAQSQNSIVYHHRYNKSSQKTSLNTSFNESNQFIYDGILKLKEEINKVTLQNNKIKAKIQYTHSQINHCQKFINTLGFPVKKKNSLHEQLSLKQQKIQLQRKVQSLFDAEQEIKNTEANSITNILLDEAMNKYFRIIKQDKVIDQNLFNDLKEKINLLRNQNLSIQKTIQLQQDIEKKISEQIKQIQMRFPILKEKKIKAREQYNALTFDENKQMEIFKQHLLQSHQKDKRRRNLMTSSERTSILQKLDKSIQQNDVHIKRLEYLLQNQQFQNMISKQNYIREIESEKNKIIQLKAQIQQYDNHIFFIQKVEMLKSDTDLENHYPDQSSR